MDKPIDPSKKYTCNGCRVINIRIIPLNSAGNQTTYQVKGTVIISEKPLRTQYRIWSIDGLNDVVWGQGQEFDLKEVE